MVTVCHGSFWRDPYLSVANLPERGHNLAFRMGPSGAAPLRVMASDETIASPEMHLGIIHAGRDESIAAWHAHLRASVIPPRPAGKEFYTIAGRVVEEKDEWILREIDIAAEMGSPIKATADGVVVFAGWTFHDGYMVILKHKYNFFSFYKHNQQNLCQDLEYVKKGQVIALLGDTGQITSGAHLHFEIWQGSMPLDPITFLQMGDI